MAILRSEGERLFARVGDQRRERHAHRRSWRHGDPGAQAENGVEHAAGRVRQRPSGFDRKGRAGVSIATDEARAIRLVLQARGCCGAQHVNGPDRRLGLAARPSRGEQCTALRIEVRADEQIRERRVGEVGSMRGEHQLRVAGEFDFTVTRTLVAEAHPAQFTVVFRRDDDFERRTQFVVQPADRDPFLAEHDCIFVRDHGRWLKAGRPVLAVTDIAQIDEAAPGVSRGILAPSRHGPAAAQAVACAGIRDHHAVVAIREQMRDRRGRHDPMHVSLEVRRLGIGARHGILGFYHLGSIGKAHGALLQQQFGSPDHRHGMEPCLHHAAVHRIVERHQRHALVMCHEGTDHDGILGIRHAPLGEVDRFIEAVAPTGTQRRERPEVLDGLERLEHGSERGGVRRHDALRTETPLQAEGGKSESRILVRQFAVTHVVRRLRDAPGLLVLATELDLMTYGIVVCLVQQAAARLLHDECRHQVFEHRSRPRCEHGVLRAAGESTTELEPVGARHIAFRDGDQAGKPGFRCQQVIVTRIEFRLAKPVADGEQAAATIEQEAESGLVDDLGTAHCQAPEIISKFMAIADHTLELRAQGGAARAIVDGLQRRFMVTQQLLETRVARPRSFEQAPALLFCTREIQRGLG